MRARATSSPRRRPPGRSRPRRRGRPGGPRPRCNGPGCAGSARARCPAVAMATCHPSPDRRRAPASSGTKTSSKKISAKPGLPVELGDGPDRDARGVHGEQEVGEAPVALGLGIGAEEPEAPVGEGAPRAPRLLAVQAASRRRPAQRDGPAARCAARSLPASGSDQPWHQISSPDAMRRQEARLLLGRCRARRSSGPGGRCRSGRPGRGPGPVVLLLEDQPLDEAGAAPAVLGRARRPPTSGRRTAGPPRPGAASKPSAVSSEARAARKRGRDPPARRGLGAERLLVGV